MNNKKLPPHLKSSLFKNIQPLSSSASLRELLDSLSREQKYNQELLVSLGFALRSFTNINRFLELVPLIASRLVGVKNAFLIPFQEDGRL